MNIPRSLDRYEGGIFTKRNVETNRIKEKLSKPESVARCCKQGHNDYDSVDKGIQLIENDPIETDVVLY